MTDFKVTNRAGSLSDLSVSRAKISNLTVDTTIVSNVPMPSQFPFPPTNPPTNLQRGTLWVSVVGGESPPSTDYRVFSAPTPP